MRFVLPAIILAITITLFFVFVSPAYKDLAGLRAEASAYNEALSNSKALENERDKLAEKYNTFDRSELAKLEKLLPPHVDNIRLILEIEQIAFPYGMAIKNVKYNVADKEDTTSRPSALRQTSRDYDSWELEFTTSGSYENFMKFTRDLENNLRIIDVVGLDFSSNVLNPSKNTPQNSYEYHFKVRTYWLKN